MKVFKFEKRIPATRVEYYEVTAKTEAEAFALVRAGNGFQESFTDTVDGEVELELYDTDEVEPEVDSAGYSIADRYQDDDDEASHHCDDPSCNCSL
jgi:hypothetical protein